MLCLEIENVSICDEQCLPQTEKVDLKKKKKHVFSSTYSSIKFNLRHRS